MSQPGTDPGFVRSGAYTILGALFKKKNAKLGTKVNIYLGSLGCAVRGPEASASLASQQIRPWSQRYKDNRQFHKSSASSKRGFLVRKPPLFPASAQIKTAVYITECRK